MSFIDRVRLHDKVLDDDLPRIFKSLGIKFQRQGYEVTLAKDDLLITHLEDTTSRAIRFRPDGLVAVGGSTYRVELKTVLPEQTSTNYDFEMGPYERALASHLQGDLVVYVFWPVQKACWVNDAKPDWIGVPQWRWNEQDYLRVKHRYGDWCKVAHIEVKGGSGTIFGLLYQDRIRAMQSLTHFWQEVQGKCQIAKQSRFL